MELKCNLKYVHNVVQHTEKFKSRKVWVSVPGEYPQTLELQVTQGKVDIFDGISPGAPIICHLNLRGREWEKDGKVSVFNTIECWRVEADPGGTQTPVPGNLMDKEAPDVASKEDLEQLPF